MTDKADIHLFEVLLTAAEAFPSLERQFLSARDEVLAGFRNFDPFTTLRSEEARRCGETWFDLIVDTLNRGVRVSFVLSDFDPVIRPADHKYAWDCVRGLIAAGEASRRPELLHVHASMHPARVGLLPRLMLWPRLLKEIRSELAAINASDKAGRERYLAHVPHLRPLLRWRSDLLEPRRFPPPPLVPVTHHQKLAVFDRERVYIGGLDLNDRRYDTPQHDRAAEETWHDTQLLLNGPVAREAAEHLLTFERGTAGRTRPVATRHLLRTLSSRRRMSFPYLSPKPQLSELADAHRDEVARSERLIYLETQFFRDRVFAKQLARRAVENPDLTLILILPAAPEDAAFGGEPSSDVAYGEHLQVKSLEILSKAFGSRLFVGAPAQPRPTTLAGRATHFDAPIVYLHAKVSIFDDRTAIVSSANLNGRSLSWDTEAGLAVRDCDDVLFLRDRCFRHWIGGGADQAFFDPVTACAAWRNRASLNASRAPGMRAGFILPYAVEPGAELARNLPGVPEEMV